MRPPTPLLGFAGLLARAAGPAWAAEAAALPEPTSLPLLVLAATGLLVGRRLAR